MILDKYLNKKRLGKGAYGDVYLVEDQKGRLLALKLISLKKMSQQPHLQEYLDGEIETMKAIDTPYIIKLYDVHKDKDFVYLVLEYCDGGDLINYQAKFKDKVFPLNKATEVLSEIIKGLEALHEAQYLHRDIKSQNVLVKVQNGREIFKLADFGFSKKQADANGTILGTQQYMSPQIFQGDQYGYEVDMWAFGVLFFFMLNMEFPFKMNPHWPPNKKKVELMKAADNFSYSAAVKKTKKGLTANCTADMEDLFQQIFCLDQHKRINFAQIRKHRIFSKYFPEVAQSSIILYSKKFKAKEHQPSKIIHKYKDNGREDVVPTSKIYRKPNLKFQIQKETLGRKKDQLDFLRDNADIFLHSGQYLAPQIQLMVAFNIKKYYIIQLRKHRAAMNNQNFLKNTYPNLKWSEYCQTDDFKKQVKDANDDLGQAEVKFSNLYQKCQHFLKEISDVNTGFKKAFHQEITETEFEGVFKESYRKSTVFVFGRLRQLQKKDNKKGGNKLSYVLCVLLFSNSFNSIFADTQNLRDILKDYLNESKKNVSQIDYPELRNWLESSDQAVLHEVARNIIKAYFGS